MKSNAEIMQDLQDNQGETMGELLARRGEITWRATSDLDQSMAGNRQGFIGSDWHDDNRWRVLPPALDARARASLAPPAMDVNSRWTLERRYESASHICFGGWALVQAEFDTAEDAMAATLTMDPATGKEQRATA